MDISVWKCQKYASRTNLSKSKVKIGFSVVLSHLLINVHSKIKVDTIQIKFVHLERVDKIAGKA